MDPNPSWPSQLEGKRQEPAFSQSPPHFLPNGIVDFMFDLQWMSNLFSLKLCVCVCAHPKTLESQILFKLVLLFTLSTRNILENVIKHSDSV